MPTEFFTVDQLLTYAGCMMATVIVVAFSKDIIKRWLPDWTVRVYAWAVAVGIMTFALWCTGGLTAEAFGLAVLNGVLVALAAVGLRETFTDPWAEKTKWTGGVDKANGADYTVKNILPQTTPPRVHRRQHRG